MANVCKITKEPAAIKTTRSVNIPYPPPNIRISANLSTLIYSFYKKMHIKSSGHFLVWRVCCNLLTGFQANITATSETVFLHPLRTFLALETKGLSEFKLSMKRTAFKYAGIYTVYGLLWLLCSSYLLQRMSFNSIGDFFLSLFSALFLLAGTAFLLYLAISHGSKKVLENRNQYKRLFEENPNPMWVYDAENLRILAVNAAALLTYRYSREEFL